MVVHEAVVIWETLYFYGISALGGRLAKLGFLEVFALWEDSSETFKGLLPDRSEALNACSSYFYEVVFEPAKKISERIGLAHLYYHRSNLLQGFAH